MTKLFIQWMEAGLIPDVLIRVGIRRLCQSRLTSLKKSSEEDPQYESNYAKLLLREPVAIETAAANQQHYEVPAEFFELVLGRNRKYSSGFWPSESEGLDSSENAALEATMERAELADGMEILELGCGWGSLTLAMGKKFPNSKITAISNSNSQREFIENKARELKIENLKVYTRDVAKLESLDFSNLPFDRVVSVEMFEHMLNYETLINRISRWLKPGGKLFVHLFSHRQFPYRFETEGEDNWMGKYFFTGGQMPSHQLLSHFQKDMRLKSTWIWSGTHYQKTAEAWLQKMDFNKDRIQRIFQSVYGESESKIWLQRWRVFFIAVAELFGFNQGKEWGVSHYLFEKD